MKAAYVIEPAKMIMTDLPMPELEDGEALIEIVYAGVCGSDITMYKGAHPTAKPPVVLGHEIFGIIREMRTSEPTNFRVGDRVTAEPLISCGVCEACVAGYSNVCASLRLLGIHENGAYAQYTKASIKKLVHIPDELPDRIAALAEPFAVAYHVVHRSGLRMGEDALVIGGGPIGNVVGFMAKAVGANVVISEPNAKRKANAEKLGFCTIDPMHDDMDALVHKMTGGNGFDVVFEASGSKAGIVSTTKLCKIHGTIVPLALGAAPVDFILGQVSFKEQTVVGSRVYPFLHFVRGVKMLAAISRQYDLTGLISDIMPLDQAQKALDMMMAGENACKILLDPRCE